MPVGPHVFALLEAALTDSFQYHNDLDAFLLRAGMPQASLATIRKAADEGYKGQYTKTPKRIVVQQLLHELGSGRDADDRLVASIITALTKGRFPEATQAGLDAIKALKAEQAVERQEAETKRAEHRTQQQEAQRTKDRAGAARTSRRERFETEFFTLSAMTDSQQRGYALERFLNEFLEFEGLDPRGSFKLTGEQIDGSFAWASSTYLVEAKWVKDRIAGAEFGAFIYKVSGKSADTRGLYIAVNGYSEQALEGLRMKGELRFVCIDGSHLLRALASGWDFSKLLNIVWRYASETGQAYLPVSSARFMELAG